MMMRILAALAALGPFAAAGPAAVATPVAAELVRNATAAQDLTGWSAAAAAGPVAVQRVTGLTGGPAAATGVRLSRGGASGAWAYALVALRTPAAFTVGQTYRMSVWLRDTAGPGRTFGLLLASGEYRHRPTETAEYAAPADSRWHLVTRTFVATAAGAADTALYLSLPTAGPFDVQVTGASVQSVSAPAPARVRTGPSRVLGFSGPAIDPKVWGYDLGGGGWGNGERQTYTSSPANARLDGAGHLAITAVRTAQGFTSARLTTHGKVTVAAGSYVEAAITAPVGASVWPAFWLLGADIDTVGWPACGELDAFEGTGSRPTLVQSAVHMAVAGSPRTDRQYGWGEAGGTTDVGLPLDARSHVFGVYFDAQTVRFYVDRRPTMSLWAADALASGRTWPFGGPQFLLLNVAVAGGVDNSATRFPRTMTVGPISIWAGGVPF
ncbi:glycoside hydrolase family 16 protein [Dactylosporangium vinaceum]|nr:glycoside hydrolase family 16 protein [Dactylosporangium vinaceum]